MTVGGYIIFAILSIAIIIFLFYIVDKLAPFSWGDKEKFTLLGTLSLIAVFILFIGMNWYYQNTAAGERALKDQQSNFNNGLSRTITVYDINGKIIKTYKGRFDIGYNEYGIKFDDENGNRHQIYYSTGTIIIDEE